MRLFTVLIKVMLNNEQNSPVLFQWYPHKPPLVAGFHLIYIYISLDVNVHGHSIVERVHLSVHSGL